MGIVGNELKSQLDRFRSIRNAFAHAMLSVSFDDELIAAECRKLDPHLLTKLQYRGVDESKKKAPTGGPQVVVVGHVTEQRPTEV